MQSFITIRVFFIVFLSLASGAVSARNFNVTGQVSYAKTGETLIGVSILPKGGSLNGTTTNSDGKFTLSLPPGEYVLLFSYMGYDNREVPVTVANGDVKRDVTMTQTSLQLDEVLVTSKRLDSNVSNAQTGVTRMEVQQLNKLPVLMGERCDQVA